LSFGGRVAHPGYACYDYWRSSSHTPCVAAGAIHTAGSRQFSDRK
jgi:hypothetical protein